MDREGVEGLHDLLGLFTKLWRLSQVSGFLTSIPGDPSFDL